METQAAQPSGTPVSPEAQAYHADFALHTLGWKAFQDLCAQVMEEELGATVQVYREAQDGGQDAVLTAKKVGQAALVGTVQCKHSGKRDQRLQLSDISGELEHVRELVAKGMASTYYFVTSMGVDAGVAAAIRAQLTALGVSEPYVHGKEWIFLKIKKSARLRAMVPRVYGLGDLSTILDERCAAQTQAILRDHRKSLGLYVPTAPHRRAVQILAEHRLVLLLGAPATGKSTLAAILATLAVDRSERQAFKCDGPLELRQHWNPHETKRLFWIDDAFGSNLLMPDYMNAWMEFMPKLKVAVEQGCHFILTSRTHIWNDAKSRLGGRSHPLLSNEAAVVNVGDLTSLERQQILYNHLKAGNQPPAWKAAIKRSLEQLSREPRLLPELARRLGDHRYTGNIKVLPADLLRFISEPQKFLVQTFQELSDAQQAALTLVFLAQSKLPVHALPADAEMVAASYGVNKAAMTQGIAQLAGSLLVRRKDGHSEYWTFWHPTFADAISEILSQRPDLIDIYIRGARLDTLLTEVICEGVPPIQDAVLVPTSSSAALVERLLETPDEPEANAKLLEFLNRRLPIAMVRKVLERAPKILERTPSRPVWYRLERDEAITLKATAHSLDLLPEETRALEVDSLHFEALYMLDASFIQDENVLGLFRPHELMNLVAGLLAKLDSEIPEKIIELQLSADPDGDIDSHFEKVEGFLDDICFLVDGARLFSEKRQNLKRDLAAAKDEVRAKKAPEPEEESIFDWAPSAAQPTKQGGRSIFSDVDE